MKQEAEQKIDEQGKKKSKIEFWSPKIKIPQFFVTSLKIKQISWKNAVERKASEPSEIATMAVNIYFSSCQWYMQIHYLSQHAATFGFLLNKVLCRHNIQSSGIL